MHNNRYKSLIQPGIAEAFTFECRGYCEFGTFQFDQLLPHRAEGSFYDRIAQDSPLDNVNSTNSCFHTESINVPR